MEQKVLSVQLYCTLSTVDSTCGADSTLFTVVQYSVYSSAVLFLFYSTCGAVSTLFAVVQYSVYSR